MRRLAWAAGAFSAAIFAANYILPGPWLLPLAGLLVLLGAGLVLLRRRWLRAAVIASFAAAVGLSCFFVHARMTTVPASKLDVQTRPFTATLLDYPDEYEDYTRAELRVKVEGLPAIRTLLYDRGGALTGAEPGDSISGEARFSAADTRYGRDYDAWHARDIYLLADSEAGLSLSKATGMTARSFLMKTNRSLTERVDAIFPEDCSAFFLALMLGEKGSLYEDDALYVSMSRAGIMHIVAVSGMHVAFLVGLLQLLLGVNRRSSLLCIALVWLFVFVSGASPSALRAAFMQTTLLLAPLLRRENDPPTSLLTALALLLFINPHAAASVSLQLSFASVAGLLLFGERIRDAIAPARTRGVWNALLRYLAGSFAATFSVLIFSVPLIAVYFGSVPLLSPLTNALVLWAVPLCFGGGYLACALSWLFPAAGAALARLIAWPARFLLTAARLISAVPFASLYTSDRLIVFWLILCYLLAAISLLWKGSRRLRVIFPTALAVFALCFALTATRQYYKSGTGTIAVLDVGQGQSIAVFSGDSTVLVDCGNIYSSDNAGDVAGSYLLGCGRRRVDALILTHLHADHADGVTRLMELIEVDRIYMPVDPPDDDGLLEPILNAAEKHGTDVFYVEKDFSAAFGGIRASFYAPGLAGDANERCLCLKLSLGDYDMLVTGDINKAAEKELIDAHRITRIELLIVGHHGSRYSSCGELLGSIGADTAVISVGYNKFGHPTYETLERLVAYGYTVYRTDQNGTVEIRVA